MQVKTYKAAEILSLVLLSALTIIAIKSKQISIFYVIYLFWIDEFLKTVFDYFTYAFKRQHLPHPKAYKHLIGSRLFMLMVYFVFVVVFFGLMLDWSTSDVILNNFEVFFFKNHIFNFSVLGFLAREVFLFYNSKGQVISHPHHILSKGIITLHISIILGVFMWALFSGKFGDFDFDLGAYTSTIAVLPFIIIKLIFEYFEIRNRFLQD